jgi:hypothetical protein
MAQIKLATVQKASTSSGLRDRVPAVKCITLRVRVDDAYPCETDHDFPDDALPGLAGLPAFRPSITTRDGRCASSFCVRSETFKLRTVERAHTFRTRTEWNAELTRLLTATCLAYHHLLPGRSSWSFGGARRGRVIGVRNQLSQRLMFACGDTTLTDRNCAFIRQAMRRGSLGEKQPWPRCEVAALCGRHARGPGSDALAKSRSTLGIFQQHTCDWACWWETVMRGVSCSVSCAGDSSSVMHVKCACDRISVD